MVKKTLAALACTVALAAGCASTTETAKNDPYFGYVPPSSEAAAGIQVFHRCKKCHSMDPSKNTFGPNLRGVYMREAAALPRFDYSDALKKSGIVWDDANLRGWVAGNTMVVSDTRMRHVKIEDPAEQDYLVEFLKTFK